MDTVIEVAKWILLLVVLLGGLLIAFLTSLPAMIVEGIKLSKTFVKGKMIEKARLARANKKSLVPQVAVVIEEFKLDPQTSRLTGKVVTEQGIHTARLLSSRKKSPPEGASVSVIHTEGPLLYVRPE